MKVLSCLSPGHLEFLECPEPKVQTGKVLIHIRRIGVCGTDVHAFQGSQPYFQYPRVLGHELAGTVADNGGNHSFSIGEPVTIMPYVNCGMCASCLNGKTNCCRTLSVIGVHQDGGMAEYLSVPARLVIKSHGLNLTALATVEPLAIGTHAIRRAAPQANETVAVLGAGPIGIGIIAAALRSTPNVIVLEPNANRRRFCEQHLNIQTILDPTNPSATNDIRERTHDNFCDVVIDATGNRMAIESMPDYLAHGGRMVLVGLQKEKFAFSHPEFHRKEATLMSSRNATLNDFQSAIDLLKSGDFPMEAYLTHELDFRDAVQGFPQLLKYTPAEPCRSNTEIGLIKAHICLE